MSKREQRPAGYRHTVRVCVRTSAAPGSQGASFPLATHIISEREAIISSSIIVMIACVSIISIVMCIIIIALSTVRRRAARRSRRRAGRVSCDRRVLGALVIISCVISILSMITNIMISIYIIIAIIINIVTARCRNLGNRVGKHN